MKTVYIVWGDMYYEGNDVLGVFESREKAEACLLSYMVEAGATNESLIEYDNYTISSHEVQ